MSTIGVVFFAIVCGIALIVFLISFIRRTRNKRNRIASVLGAVLNALALTSIALLTVMSQTPIIAVFACLPVTGLLYYSLAAAEQKNR